MRKRGQRRQQASDLYAELHQSACDKLLSSVKYPFTAFEHREQFPGCSRSELRGNASVYQYTKSEIKKMLRDAVKYVRENANRRESSVHDQIFAFGGSVIEQAKRVLDAAISGGSKYEGPSKSKMQEIVDGGIEGLVDTLGDWGVYAWCPYLRVVVMQRPQLTLASPRIDLTNVIVEVTATGELWVKFPWWNCYQWCLKWEKVIKCEKIASITVSETDKEGQILTLLLGNTCGIEPRYGAAIEDLVPQRLLSRYLPRQ